MTGELPERRVLERRASAEGPRGPERRGAERRLAVLTRRVEIAPHAVHAARRVLVVAALTVAVVDLTDEAVSPTLPSAYHARGPSGALAMAAMVVIGAWMFPRLGSRLIAAAGGLMVGGGIANVLSLGIWGRGVPNPLVSDRLGIAYNLADVAIGLGLVSMLAATLLFAVQHRGELSARL